MVGRRALASAGLLALLVPLLAAGPAGPAQSDALAAVIAAERAFSAASQVEGPRAAFLRFFADEVVTFGPAPRVGKAHLEGGPDFGPLVWEPEIAEVSAAGDMGYTAGPYRAGDPTGPVAHGHYHSVWERTRAGDWHVLLDVGGPHGESPGVVGVETPSSPNVAHAPAPDDGERLEALLERDRAYASATAADGEAALERFTFARLWTYRAGQLPLRGRDAARTDQSSQRERAAWQPMGGRVSSSDDFGFTYGDGTVSRADLGPDPMAISYARIWRRDGAGEWRVVLEVVLPYPASTGVEPVLE